MSATIRLSIRRGDQEVAAAVARDQSQKIGRSKQCDVVLDDPAVSRVHALLTLENGEAVLTDQNSQNGLWVQGNRVGRIVLDPSVVVAMGPFRILCETTTVAERGDETMLIRPVQRTPAGPPEAAAAPPPAPPSVAPPLPGRTTVKTRAVPVAAPAAASSPAVPAAEAPVPSPVAATPRESSGKTMAAPPAKPAAVPRLPPPPSKPTVPASLAAKKAANQSAALLLVAVIVMLIVGGVGTTLLLRWRSARGGTPVAGDAQTSTTSVASPVTTTSAPPPPVASTSAPSDVAASTTSATTVPLAADGPSTAPNVPTSSVESTPEPSGGRTAAGGATSSKAPTPTSSAPRRPNDAPAGVILATPKPRETRAALVKRSSDMTARLNQGRAAVDKGDFAAAIETLSALEREQADFGDVAAQLERARDGQRAATRQRAQAAFDDAQQKEKQQDFVGAIQGYQQAEKIDPEFAARAAAAIAAARARQKAIVDELFKQANTDFAFRRPSAIPLYQRILKLLADDDPRRTEAQTKLNQLTGGKQQ